MGNQEKPTASMALILQAMEEAGAVKVFWKNVEESQPFCGAAWGGDAASEESAAVGWLYESRSGEECILKVYNGTGEAVIVAASANADGREGMLVARAYEALAKLRSWQLALFQASMADDFEPIMQAGYEWFQRPFQLLTGDFEVIAHIGGSIADPNSPAFQMMVLNSVVTDDGRYFTAESYHAPYLYETADNLFYLCANIFLDGLFEARITMETALEGPCPAQSDAFSFFLPYLSTVYRRLAENRHAKRQRDTAHSLVRKLVADGEGVELTDAERFAWGANAAIIDEHLLFAVPIANEQAAPSLCRILEREIAGSIAIDQPGAVLLVCPRNSRQDAEEILKRVDAGKLAGHIAISAPFREKEELAPRCLQALAAVHNPSLQATKGLFVDCAANGFEIMLGLFKGNPLLDGLGHPALKKLKEAKPDEFEEYLRVLRDFAGCAFSQTRAAKLLYVSRSTIQRKLQEISDICGDLFYSFEDTAYLTMSLALFFEAPKQTGSSFAADSQRFHCS